MRLIMVHGRAQEGKDPDALKLDWLGALARGLAGSNRPIPSSTAIELPYYGNLLAELVRQANTPLGADVNAKGPNPDSDPTFRGEMLSEFASAMGLTDADIQRELTGVATQKGPGSWEWVQGIIRAMDRVPGVNVTALDLFTRDVYVYLSLPGVRRRIDKVVDDAIGTGPCVVLAHSLGTVVAYNVLRNRKTALQCPLFVTVGSPLGIRAVKRYLDSPLMSPQGVAHWFNAYDDRDLVALRPLDHKNFGVAPPIENKSDVKNFTSNHHGIAGYASDPVVASRLRHFL